MSQERNNTSLWINGSETTLSLTLLGIVGIMLVPLPPIALDMLIAINLSFTIFLLLITLGINKALDLSVFPSLLLVMTLYRLALNVASTRRILLSANGGQLVAAFGSYVVGGNLIVGFVVFLILVLIQFIVITKGASRISEVSARFTLDALPGKQLAIDADLNAGAITEKEAKQRREELSLETDFYGAMDGASKFVRGDAIAGLIITAINIVGGIAIGMTNGMSIQDSIRTYSTLTIGDGLVSQIPALVIAIAAGILVTKTTSKDSLGQEIGGQLLKQERPLWIGFGFTFLLCLLPGVPKIPFILLAGGQLIWLARKRQSQRVDNKPKPEDKSEQKQSNEEQDDLHLNDFLFTDRATIDVGAGLLGLVKPANAKGLAQRIKSVRREFSQERGLWIPPIRVRSSLNIDPLSYEIRIAGRVVGKGTLRPDKNLAIPPENASIQLSGESTIEPTFGLEALWIDSSDKTQAEAHRYTVVDASGVLITHLRETLKRFGHELITRESLKNMLDGVKEFAPTIVDEVQSESVRMSLLHQVVQQLAADHISLADFALVLEAVVNNAPFAKSADDLTDAVRQELGHLVCAPHLNRESKLRVLACEPQLESKLAESLREGRLALMPQTMEKLIAQVTEQLATSKRLGEPLVLLADHRLRRPLRRLLSKNANGLGFVSYQELSEQIELEPVAILTLRDLELTSPQPAKAAA